MTDSIEKRLEEIQKRNIRVEADEAWELSNTRRMAIGVSIYVLALAVFLGINAPNPYVNALIPALGFVLSTTTFPIFKQICIDNHSKKR